jgi:hypothetical protein
LMQPGERTLNHPTIDAQSAAVLGIAFGQNRFDAALFQRVAMRLRVVSAIPQDLIRTPSRAAWFSGDRWNRVDQRQQLGYVVTVRAGEFRGQRNALRIGDEVMLRPAFSAICRIRTGLRPPKTARTLALSTTARDQSSRSAACRWLSNTCRMSSHTPASCHSCNRRQQVIPHPQPISWGRSSQPMPVLSTKRIPVRAFRWGTGGRPPLGRGFAAGNTGSTSSHSSSVSRGLAIGLSSMTTKMYTADPAHRHDRSSIMRFC